MSWATEAARRAHGRSLVFATGAGISQESGIPTFRGKDGLWRNHDPMRLATIHAFEQDPQLVWQWYEERRQNVLAAEPNAGHRAIAAMQAHARVSVLTQNIDGLHARAGSSDIAELHGNIVRTRCTSCGFSAEDMSFDALPPRCSCGELLRPDVVWFGEALPQGVWARAAELAAGADVMVVAGTSLAVSPANSLPALAQENGALLVEVNPCGSEMSDMMDICVRQTSAAALPELERELGRLSG